MQQANPINISNIDHVVIRAENLERMIDFYSNILGCRLERGPGSFGIAQLRAGNSLIDLADAKSKFGKQAGGLPDHGAPNMDHICFRVDPWDTETIVARLEEHQIEHGEVGTRYGASGRGPSIYLKDPEGNTGELKGMN